MKPLFDLFLFSTNPREIRDAVAAGVEGVVVDWEQVGKADRQHHADTEINRHTVEDLRIARASTRATVVCRINPVGVTTEREIEDAIAAGANEILLPMVRSVKEVSAAVGMARERCGVGILVETVEAVESAGELARLPLSRVYVGLNDLMIDRGHTNIFTAVLDGTIERIRSNFSVPFGFGGLTLVERGFPVPCRLLIAEMARLDCRFSFLRRSFHRDMAGHRPSDEIPRILEAITIATRRRSDEIVRDRFELADTINRMLFERPARLEIA